jgi:AbrB family looped-hinge helix DNA binding protein
VDKIRKLIMVGQTNLILKMRRNQVLVTRRGQTTIPARIRRKLRIYEGTRLNVQAKGDKVVFTKAPSLSDLDGTSKLTRSEAFRLLDKMREEE